MTTKPEAFTFSLDDRDPRASTMRLDLVGNTLTAHTSAAQATLMRSTDAGADVVTLAMAVARCAYAEGRAAAGADASEVVLTAPEAADLPTRVGGRWMGATAWLHYTDDAGRLQCGAKVERVRGFHGAANIVAAVIEGAVVCPRCAEMHRLEAEAVATGATRVE